MLFISYGGFHCLFWGPFNNTDNFIRIRIGIEKPSKISTTDYVLGKFKNLEKKSLEEPIFIVERISESLITNGIKETMQNFN